MLAVCWERAREAGVAERLDLRLGDLRRPPVDERVPLVTCPFRAYLHLASDEERLEALRAARGLLAARRAPRLRRLRAVARGRRGDARPLDRARAGHRRARRLGSRRADADALGARRAAARRRWCSAWLEPERWHSLLAEAGFEVTRVLRLVRPPAVRRRRGQRVDRCTGLANSGKFCVHAPLDAARRAPHRFSLAASTERD